jgi:GT2 family glycosyltransferase
MTDSLQPELSVIITNRNTAHLLLTCLEHIFRSDLGEKPEVLVVDNGSSDDSVEKVKTAYPSVIILEAGKNLGFGAANNVAAKLARGRYLLLVNTDAFVEKDCARVLLELMKSDTRIGMVGPQLLNEDGSPQTSFEATPTLVTETLNRSLLKRLFPTRFPGKQLHVKKAFPVEALIGAVMMLRREYFDALDGFDEDYFFFLEETDLAVKMRQAGWQILHEPRAKAIHLQGATADIAPPSARIEFYRSRYIFFGKHYGSGATRVLKSVLTANLMLNVAGLGLIALATLGQARSVGNRLRVRTELLKWHLQGCPDGQGLPRE